MVALQGPDLILKEVNKLGLRIRSKLELCLSMVFQTKTEFISCTGMVVVNFEVG